MSFVLDTQRARRTGLPEVIYCQGKTPEQVQLIAQKLKEHHPILATKATPEHYAAVKQVLPGAGYNKLAKIIRDGKLDFRSGNIQVVTAGTTDIPVAEECLETLRFCGFAPENIFDVGVAGLERILSKKDLLQQADVVIVIAGMDGALPSVVGGLVSCPVIAVPTSIGYGSAFEGLSALLAMLNSCTPGLAVVNIDNGFGAAVLAEKILRAGEK